MLLAIDPGPIQSAWVLYDPITSTPCRWEKQPNHALLALIDNPPMPFDRMVVEMIASYGMAVGAEVFETCVWIGRFLQAHQQRWVGEGQEPAGRVFRREVKLHLCGSPRARDGNVRQALIDRYGPGRDKAVGRKATPGPLYGMSGDCWAALGVAITATEM